MPSFKTTVLAIATVFTSGVVADYVIDPNSVSPSVRDNWCQNEKSTCPIICEQTPPGTTEVNSCDAESLTYGCVCGNGLQPNMSEYSLTLPYFVCQEWGNQCVKGCGGDNACASSCRQDHPCGAQNPTRANTTSSATSSATPTDDGSSPSDTNAVYTGLDSTGATETATPGSAAMRIRAWESGSAAGFFVLVASICAGVAVMM